MCEGTRSRSSSCPFVVAVVAAAASESQPDFAVVEPSTVPPEPSWAAGAVDPAADPEGPVVVVVAAVAAASVAVAALVAEIVATAGKAD